AQGDEPEPETRVSSVLALDHPPQLDVLATAFGGLGEPLLDPLHMGVDGAQISEEKLEEQFVSYRSGSRRLREPPAQHRHALSSDLVDLPVGTPDTADRAPPRQALGGEPAERRVDLAVALIPEVADAAHGLLAN